MKTTVIKKRTIITYLIPIGIGDLVMFTLLISAIDPSRKDISYVYTLIAIFTIFTLLAIWGIFKLLRNKFEINSDGVIYKTKTEEYYMRWEDIDSIMIYPNPSGILNKSSMICFTKGNDHLLRYRSIKQFSENFFGVQFRETIIHEIRKYWDKPIQGIYQITGKNM